MVQHTSGPNPHQIQLQLLVLGPSLLQTIWFVAAL